MTERAKRLWRRYDKLREQRTTWESHWEEVAERVLPRVGGSFTSGRFGTVPGQKRNQKLFDSTAPLALEKFAAAMESMLTPRNATWHRLRASDESLNRKRRVQVYFEEMNRKLFRERYATTANFAGQQHEVYLSLGAFGTGSLFIDGHAAGRGLRYRALGLSEFVFDVDHQGMVDTVMRCIKYTARQIKQRWPDVELPDSVAKVLANPGTGDETQTFEVLHAVTPREAHMVRYDRGGKGMPFASWYCLRDEYVELSEGGYLSFPFTLSRYVTGPGELYGRSPAMMALPGIKTLNEQKKTLLRQGQRAVDPVLLAHDDGVIDAFSLKSGAVNYGGVSAEGRPLVHTLPTGNLAVGDHMMELERAAINDAFLVTLFQILVETPQMTATEVMERAREKGVLLSPTMGRQQSEALGPQIEREIDILTQQGAFGPLPPELVEADGQYHIEYDSPLSRAQRAEEAAGFLRVTEFGLQYAAATGDVSPLDHLDMDAATPALAAIYAVPPSWVSTPEQVAARRQERAEANARREAIEAAPAAAGLMKAGSDAGG